MTKSFVPVGSLPRREHPFEGLAVVQVPPYSLTCVRADFLPAHVASWGDAAQGRAASYSRAAQDAASTPACRWGNETSEARPHLHQVGTHATSAHNFGRMCARKAVSQVPCLARYSTDAGKRGSRLRRCCRVLDCRVLAVVAVVSASCAVTSVSAEVGGHAATSGLQVCDGVQNSDGWRTTVVARVAKEVSLRLPSSLMGCY